MRGNGERIGPQNLPTSSIAGGIWNLLNQQRAQQRGAWPSATPAVVTDPYFMYVPLLLNTTSTNGQQNNTFLDSSTNNFTITRNGTPTQGSFTPYQPSGYWSGLFGGTSDYLTIANNAAFDLGTGDCTIEAWIFTNSLSANQTVFSAFPSSGSITGYAFNVTTSGYLIVDSFVSGTEQFIQSSNNPITANSWFHVAYTRSSGTNRLFVNGNLCTTSTNTLVQALNTGGNSQKVGYQGYTGFLYPFNGYISNLRVVKGTAVYTGAFTPSTTPLTAITNTSLLTLQSNRFIDNSTNAFAITVNGTPKVQAFQPFSPAASYSAATYGGSGYFPSSSYLSVPYNVALNLVSGDFTIETWFYCTALTASYQIILDKDGVNGAAYAQYGFSISSTGILGATLGNGAGLTPSLTDYGNNTPVTLNMWNHVAMVRTGTTIKVFLNGAQINSTAQVTAMSDGGKPLLIGYQTGQSSAFYFNGYISNTRIVKGTAIYTAAFTPPTLPVTAVSGTSLLTNFTNAGIYDAAWQNNALTVGDAQVSTTQAQWPTTSMKFDGTGDWLTAIDSPGLQLGSGDFTIDGWVYLATNGIVYGIVSKGTAITGWSVNVTVLNKLQFSYTTSNLTGATSLSTGTWYYFAVVRSGTASGNLKVYLNGTADATSGGAVTDNFNQTSTLYIGADRIGTSPLNGYLQDIRITKGVARTITTPTAAFPTR
jgi:hypothetical protein